MTFEEPPEDYYKVESMIKHQAEDEEVDPDEIMQNHEMERFLSHQASSISSVNGDVIRQSILHPQSADAISDDEHD